MMGSAAFTSTTAEDEYSSKLFLFIKQKILSSPFTLPFHLRSVAFTFTMPAPRCVLKFLFLKKIIKIAVYLELKKSLPS